MANTVNDVMNIIANHDYGIKNIAGTNQEILAILEGSHNSPNNIHAIVNDIKNLLQNLVSIQSIPKTIEINNNTSTKIKQKHIEVIIDETKSIKKAINDIEKTIKKQYGDKPIPATIAKLSDEASNKVADAMIKNMSKQKGLSGIVDVFNKLKNISLKNIIDGNKKLNKIKELFGNIEKDLDVKGKDFNTIIELINATPEILKKLQKIDVKINKVIKNNVIKKLCDIFIGKDNSILSLSILLKKHEKSFESARKATKNITILVGNLLTTSILLTVASVTAIPALLGALALKAIVHMLIPIAKTLSKNNKHILKAVGSAIIFTTFTGLMVISTLILKKIADNGTSALLGSIFLLGIISINILSFKLLGGQLKNIVLGSICLAIMSASLLIFGAALGKMSKETKDVDFIQSAVVAGSIVVLGVAIAAIGIPFVAGFIALGSIALLSMSIPLMLFSETLRNVSEVGGEISLINIGKFCAGIAELGIAISAGTLSYGAVKAGTKVIDMMTKSLIPFINILKSIQMFKESPKNMIKPILDGLDETKTFFKNNMWKGDIINNAKKAEKMMKSFSKIIEYSSKLKNNISGYGENDTNSVKRSIESIKHILNFLKFNTLNSFEIKKARTNIRILKDMSNAMSDVSLINYENITSVGDAITTTLGKVNTIDISQVNAVTNMFNAFNGINKSENILNKFTESVNKFTEACLNLLDAIEDNEKESTNDTNFGILNIGNTNEGGMNKVIETTKGEDGSETKGIRISNVDEIARNIAEKINGSLSIDIPDTQIQLLINGSSGNEWIISRY